MMNSAAAMTTLPPHRVRTVNVSINSDNKIHEDDTAARYGFRGGLVAGTLVYAHMTTPLVQRLGTAWLDGSVSELRLLQPAYDGEWLTVEGDAQDGGAGESGYRLRVRNEGGAELATLETALPSTLPPLDERAALVPAAPDVPLLPIAWDAVQVGRPLRALHWAPGREDHQRWCESAGDALALYRDGARPRIQPGRVLQGANDVFKNHFRLEPWIHTGSRIVQRGPLCLGDPIEIRAVPVEKWERKGHQFVTLYVVFLNAGRPAVEVLHTAIFKVRAAQA
jgi:hypothetical protein